VKEIAAPREGGGIGANEKIVKGVLEEHPDRFEHLTGEAAKAAGRRPQAHVWKLRRAPDAVDAVSSPGESVERNCVTASPLRDAVTQQRRTPAAPKRTQPPDAVVAPHLLGQLGYPELVLAAAVRDRHVTRAEAEERYRLHTAVAPALERREPPDHDEAAA
jgi:hypothetical protein